MPQVSPSKYLVSATWDDVPHLDEQTKKELLESIPVYQRDARSKGIPQLGSGSIFPLVEEKLTVDDFEIPDYWPRAYALDVGWNCTACLWGAWDRQSDVVYLYSAYKAPGSEEGGPVIHADAIRARGAWIPGVIDPASRGRSQIDGKRLIDEYVSLGLDLSLAENAVEAGIHAVFRRMVSGRLKIFKSIGQWFEEYRLYRRDEKGKVVKENDHLMDCTRYLIMSGMSRAIDELLAMAPDDWRTEASEADAITGY